MFNFMVMKAFCLRTPYAVHFLVIEMIILKAGSFRQIIKFHMLSRHFQAIRWAYLNKNGRVNVKQNEQHTCEFEAKQERKCHDMRMIWYPDAESPLRESTAQLQTKMEKSPAASEEHLKLATFIKNVHQQLRQQSEKLGFEKAWEMHCSQLEMLKQYSNSMANLATEHWSLNNSEAMCRISWIQLKCINYFFQSGKVKQREFEEHKLSAFGYAGQFSGKLNAEPQCVSDNDVLDLLDVGSCYNPFEIFPMFKVLAIDIAPGHPSVKKCDFLAVKLVSRDTDCVHTSDNQLEQIAKNSFDIVIFSLLLEYFPNSKSRFKCCSKAYEVLKPEGLLFIITPDSKHATANSKIMKKWRFALATLGFWRIHYEKLKHLHCMAFCKSKYPEFPKLWVEREANKCEMQEEIKNPSDLITIPQDFNSSRNIQQDTELPEERNIDDLVDLFQELPPFDSDTS